MQTPVQIICTGAPELNTLPEEQEEYEQVVVFELVVPCYSKVPPPDYELEMAALMLRESILTSTVDEQQLTLLAANNTAVGGSWYISVSIPAPQAARY